MKTVREYASQAWNTEQEKQKHARHKNAKRKAKKIEEALAELFNSEVAEYDVERLLEHPHYDAIVTVRDGGDPLQFTYDEEEELVLIGTCPGCQQETISKPIASAADLGKMLEHFAAGKAHACSGHTH